VRLLEHLGYTNIEHFHGGMHEWQDAGLTLERTQGVSVAPLVMQPAAAIATAPADIAAPAGIPADAPAVARAASRDRWHSLVDLFENRSTADLVISWFGTIVACAIVYWALSAWSMGGLREGGNVIGGGIHGVLTALYFSFVTATSVGFGDVVPLGAVRALAIFEAVVGLLIFGAVVSKLVSRRQEQIVREIHRIAFEDRLERVQTDLHSVLMEMQTIAQQCKTTHADVQQLSARLESASGMALSELRTVHDLLYRPQSLPEEAMLEGILASLAILLREMRELLRCMSFERSAYLTKNIEGVSRYAEEICSDCVPRRYAPHLREWMDAIKATAPELT
jgi:Ion channel